MRKFAKLAIGLAVAAGSVSVLASDQPAKKPAMQCCAMDAKASAALDRVKALTGTWSTSGAEKVTTTFRPTAGGSAVIETMMPGSDHEMVNLYTADGPTILMTHYCAEGVQPRMKLTSADAKPMTFEFIDGGNIKSRNDPHMDAVALTIDGEKLTEDWAFYANGKVVDHKIFEFTKQK